MVDRYVQAVIRDYNGKVYETYPLTWVAKEVGTSVPTIKRWEYQGLIPEPIFTGSHKFYTKYQVTLLRKVKAMQDKYGHKPKQILKKKSEMKGYLQRNWWK